MRSQFQTSSTRNVTSVTYHEGIVVALVPVVAQKAWNILPHLQREIHLDCLVVVGLGSKGPSSRVGSVYSRPGKQHWCSGQ